MKKYKYLKILCFTLVVAFTSSCVDLEETDFNIAETETFFETEDDIKKGVVAVYNALAKGPYSFLETNNVQGSVYDLQTIVLGSGTHVVWDTRDFGSNSFTTSSKYLEVMYLGSYFGISKANLVIEKVETIEMSDENKNQYLAEVRFLRGLFYFNLVQYFGGVPLNTEVYDYDYESANIPRSTAEEVYDFIIEDFKFAEANLPLDDFIDGDHATGRATSSAASGLLAKVYLTMAGHPLNKGVSHYQLAKDYAQKVIDLGVYKLLDDFGTIHLANNENNREMLFSVQFGPEDNGQGNWGGWQSTKENSNLDMPNGGGYARVQWTEEMTKEWHKDDPRGLYNMVKIKGNGKPEKKAYKWKTWKFRFVENRFSNNQSSINAPVLRYADILLTLAEAENEINGPTAIAFDAINAVRARARMGSVFGNLGASTEPADLVGLDQDNFRETVFWDRARELCMEGLDRFDLVRSGNYLELTENAVHVGKESKVFVPLAHFDLMPIPELAMRNNTALQGQQNPGY